MNVLTDNITLFARTLRRTGFLLGTGQILESLRAVEAIGIASKEDFRSALFSTLVTRPSERQIFAQAFDVFWQNPELFERALASMLTQTPVPPREIPKTPGARRLADAFRAMQGPTPGQDRKTLELDARATVSADELLSNKDFEQMTSDEIARARALISRMHWSLPDRMSRRTEAANRGSTFDLRRTLRKSLKTGGNIIRLERRKRQCRQPPLVVLCDISGSMSTYARMCLHFLHGLTQTRRSQRATTHVFLFGTRLTNITRALRHRDPDEAMTDAATRTMDWDGGTRIASALDEFNRNWSRRVLNQGAALLLITDGLERDDPSTLDAAAARLHRSVSRLIWLNPLLRFEEFAPKAQGIKILLKHVDELRPVHNLQSIADLADALSQSNAASRLQAMRSRVA